VADSAISAPRILPGGILELPRSGGGGGDVPLAAFGSSAPSGVAVPGLVQALSFESNLDAPRAYNGEVYFPFASNENGQEIVPGVVRAVSFERSISYPRVLNGNIHLPLAAFGSSSASGIGFPGGVQGMQFESALSAPRAENGSIYFPLANYSGAGTARPGALQMVEYVSGISAPRILEGSLQLPQGGSGGAPAGVQDVNGSAIDWQALGDGAMRATVARIDLQVSDSVSVPLALEVGMAGGYMTFALTS
jgi:hypothetical protein